MPSYQEFAQKARERFEARKQARAKPAGSYVFTSHARYKMQQYGLSEQRVKGVIRNPKRREEGIAPRTAACMQPVSVKRVAGREVWRQEIWVMFQTKNQRSKASQTDRIAKPEKLAGTVPFGGRQLTVISAWRYPGVSPERDPIPADILRELEEGSILEAEE